jgi:succinoglycan biosynthesis transport protein ExoP
MEFKYYFKILWKRKWAIAIILLLSIVIPLLLAVSSKNFYGIAAKVIINKKDVSSNFSSLLPANYGEVFYLDSAATRTNYYEIAQDESLHLKVIQQMGLKGIKAKDFQLTIPFLSCLLHAQDAGVKIEQVSDSDMIEITGYATSPEKAANIANKLVEVLIIHNQNLVRGDAERFLTEMGNRLKKVNEELAAARAKKVQFEVAENISNYDNQITAINLEISTLEYDSHKKEVKIKALDKTQQKILATLKTTPEFRMAIKTDSLDSSITAAKNSLTDLMLKLSAKKNELKESHPDVIALKNQIEAAKNIIASKNLKFFSYEQENRNDYYDGLIKEYSDNEIEKIEDQIFIEMTAQKIKVKQGKISNLMEKSSELDNLIDQISELKKYELSYMDSVEAVERIKKLNVTNISVIRYADPKIDGEKVYFPSWSKVLFICGFLGLTLAFFGALFMEYFDDRWSDPEQLADSALGIPTCVISNSKRNTIDNAVLLARQSSVGERIADLPFKRQSNAESSISNAIWELLSNIVASTEQQKMIAITSSLPGEGKSTIGFFLAQAFAEKGEQVLFIDANLADPALYSYFQGNEHQSARLSSSVLESADLKEMTVKAIGPNLDLLTGAKLNYPSMILCQDRIAKVVTTLSGLDQYDRVILDLASIQSHRAVESLLASADVVIFVIALKKAKRSLTLRDVDQIKQIKASDRIKLTVNKA